MFELIENNLLLLRLHLMIFPITALRAEVIPDTASSKTKHSSIGIPIAFAAFAAFMYISGSGFPLKVPSSKIILEISNHFLRSNSFIKNLGFVISEEVAIVTGILFSFRWYLMNLMKSCGMSWLRVLRLGLMGKWSLGLWGTIQNAKKANT